MSGTSAKPEPARRKRTTPGQAASEVRGTVGVVPVTPDLSRAEQMSADELRQLQRFESLVDGENGSLEKLFRLYMGMLMDGTAKDSRLAYMICHAVEALVDTKAEGFAKQFPIANQRKTGPRKGEGNLHYKAPGQKWGKVADEDWQTLRQYFGSGAGDVDIAGNDATFENLIRLTKILGMDENERDILRLLYVMDMTPNAKSVIDRVFENSMKKASVGFARMLGRPQDAVKIFRAMCVGSRLEVYGILGLKEQGMSLDDDDDDTLIPIVDKDVLASLEKPGMSDDEIVSILLGKERKSDLDLADFEYVGPDLDRAVELIKTAVARGEKGVNILLYGPPGSGKTELSAVLAKHLGLRLYAVGEESDTTLHVGSPTDSTAKRRTAEHGRSQALLKGSKDAVLLFDEIEDMMLKSGDRSKAADTDSKIGLNRMLEENPVVTIWTGNDANKFHKAVLQRFSMSIEMGYPPTRVREKIWTRRLELEGCNLPPEDVRDLARDFVAPPRMITKACNVLRVVGGGVDTVTRTLRTASLLVNQSSEAIMTENAIPKGFSLDFINGGQDLCEMFRAMAERGARRKPFSLLLRGDAYLGGLPFLTILAEEMSVNTIFTSFEDLTAPNPQRPQPQDRLDILFSTAVDSNAFIVIEGLEDLSPHTDSEAAYAWNEPFVHHFVGSMLQHPLPVAATVSSKKKLPPHLSVAFSNEITLQPLIQEKAVDLYKKFFGQELPDGYRANYADVGVMDMVSLRDISRKLDTLPDGGVDHERLAQSILKIKAARNFNPGVIGFTP